MNADQHRLLDGITDLIAEFIGLDYLAEVHMVGLFSEIIFAWLTAALSRWYLVIPDLGKLTIALLMCYIFGHGTNSLFFWFNSLKFHLDWILSRYRWSPGDDLNSFSIGWGTIFHQEIYISALLDSLDWQFRIMTWIKSIIKGLWLLGWKSFTESAKLTVWVN